MSTSKHIDKICCIVLAVTLALTLFFMNAGRLGVQTVSAAVGYASRLFQDSEVHTIDIVMDDWDSFLANCTDEEYVDCTVIIDGEAYRNVAIRAKGNTSLSSVAAYGNNRYSFKIEFDHYDDSLNYHGLDKLCLNNIIQDNTYMKDYLVYRLMHEFGVDAPLCSYAYMTVNGEDWGLYLAVEGVEESFLARNYGNDYGELYKPDSMKMGGGRGNGRGFDFENFDPDSLENFPDMQNRPYMSNPPDMSNRPDMSDPPDISNDPDMSDLPDMPNPPDMSNHSDMSNLPDMPNFPGMSGDERFSKGMGSSDVSLIYADNEFDSYPNIFDNAKTDPSNADKTRLIEALKNLNESEKKTLETTVDIDEVIRYFVVHNFVLNFDSYTGAMIHNYYLYEKNGQLSMIPWDYNLAFGGFESGGSATALVNYPIDTPVSGGSVDSRPMLAWIFDHQEYTELYHQYFEEFLNEYFENGALASLIDETARTISSYVEADPTKFCSNEEFEKGVSTLRSFCLRRAESVLGQLEGTIPATSEGQTLDSSSLIDASDLVVSDMGTMGEHVTPSASGRNARTVPPYAAH